MKILELDENIGKLVQMATRGAERAIAGAERAAVKAAPQAERLISDQLADRAIAAGLKLEPISAKVMPTPGGLFKDQVVRIVNYQDRAIVVVRVNGVRVPFYCSSGNAAKEGVTPGRWYPIFGIGPDGWINKGTERGISQYYGMPNLRATAQALDASLGDIRSAMEKGGFKHFGGGQQAIADINQGLNPVSRDQGFEAFKKNAYSLLRRLGADV
jgi:hypothetical protein